MTYEILMTLVSDRICELCSRLSPHNSSGVLSRSFHGQTLNVAAGQPRSGNFKAFKISGFGDLNKLGRLIHITGVNYLRPSLRKLIGDAELYILRTSMSQHPKLPAPKRASIKLMFTVKASALNLKRLSN